MAATAAEKFSERFHNSFIDHLQEKVDAGDIPGAAARAEAPRKSKRRQGTFEDDLKRDTDHMENLLSDMLNDCFPEERSPLSPCRDKP